MVEKIIFPLLTDLGNAEQPYLSPADDVGAIEI